jgi:2-dehydro-3-deoxyphosphogluconate aldolase/(4S)-4-hydroxy-2-oxoglutarate aldolase
MSVLIEQLRKLRVVPVIVIDDPKDAVPLATALIDGGLPIAEVTFRTAGAAESIRRICAEKPDLLVGAGTVLKPEQAKRARGRRIVHGGTRFQPRRRRLLPRANIPYFRAWQRRQNSRWRSRRSSRS